MEIESTPGDTQCDAVGLSGTRSRDHRHSGKVSRAVVPADSDNGDRQVASRTRGILVEYQSAW